MNRNHLESLFHALKVVPEISNASGTTFRASGSEPLLQGFFRCVATFLGGSGNGSGNHGSRGSRPLRREPGWEPIVCVRRLGLIFRIDSPGPALFVRAIDRDGWTSPTSRSQQRSPGPLSIQHSTPSIVRSAPCLTVRQTFSVRLIPRTCAGRSKWKRSKHSYNHAKSRIRLGLSALGGTR